jgi:hypothetical protein
VGGSHRGSHEERGRAAQESTEKFKQQGAQAVEGEVVSGLTAVTRSELRITVETEL